MRGEPSNEGGDKGLFYERCGGVAKKAKDIFLVVA